MNDDATIDDLDNAEDLKAVLRVMQERISDIEGQVSALKQSRPILVDRLDDLEGQLQDIGGHVELVDASLSSPQKGKIEKVMGVLDYIERDASGGRGGVTVTTGEVAAASGGSRDTALRLMDELAARFEWADVDNPGGPKPKRLKVNTVATPADERRAEVRAHYAEGEA